MADHRADVPQRTADADELPDRDGVVVAKDPSWTGTLRGKAAELYVRYEQELKPAGFDIAARVADDPNGLPGDVALFGSGLTAAVRDPRGALFATTSAITEHLAKICLVSSFRACDLWAAQPHRVVCRCAGAANKPASSPTDADRRSPPRSEPKRRSPPAHRRLDRRS